MAKIPNVWDRFFISLKLLNNESKKVIFTAKKIPNSKQTPKVNRDT